MPVAQEFPVDLPDDPIGRRPALGWTAIALSIATVSLALTNAVSIDHWSAALTPSQTTAYILGDAGRWHAATVRIGLDTPRATMHRMWRKMEEARWAARDEVDTAMQ
jgi:hypothetical protein